MEAVRVRWFDNSLLRHLLDQSPEDRPEALRTLIRRNPSGAANLIRALATTEEGLGIISALESREIALVFVKKQPGQRDRPINWHTLRPLGHFPLLKVSYVALVAIPLISHLPALFQFAGPYFFPAAYFGNLSLALAGLLYDIFCPTIVKRFASANDLYNQMLDITSKQQNLYPNDRWVGDLDHSLKAYRGAAMSKSLLAYVCFAFYLIGFALLGYVIWERSFAVGKAMMTQ